MGWGPGRFRKITSGVSGGLDGRHEGRGEEGQAVEFKRVHLSPELPFGLRLGVGGTQRRSK